MDNKKLTPKDAMTIFPFELNLAAFLVSSGHKIFSKVSFTESTEEEDAHYLMRNDGTLLQSMSQFYQVDTKLTFTIDTLFHFRNELIDMPFMQKCFKGYKDSRNKNDEVSNDA